MSLVWSIAAGAIGFLVLRDRRAGAVIGLAAFSHWVLDFVSHGPDLPLLFEGSLRVGLGLESSFPVGLIMELGLLAAGVAIYLIARKRRRAVSHAAYVEPEPDDP
jgi:phosphotransferase system  glucose/maltose/N-acetylglucosamine-specific IIC component